MLRRRKGFDDNGYTVVRSLIDRLTARILQKHALGYAAGPHVQFDNVVPETPAAYSDPVMETLLHRLLPDIQRVTGRPLYPTYSFYRVYKEGDVLRRHTDRPACEISLSLCIGYEADETWPLFIEGPRGVTAVKLEPGDAVLYKGIECPHWREAFSGKSATQTFLHYVDRTGPNAEWRFDKRAN